jgi:putative SOS response-associated peptidase YedK
MMAAARRDLFRDDRAASGFGPGIGPGQLGQVIRLHPRTGQRHLDWLTWGLLPAATENLDSALRPIHARAETVAVHPLFADAFRHRRAIVAAREYYQRAAVGASGRRYAISCRDGPPLAIAGLWETFRRPDGDMVRTCCIITVPAAGAIARRNTRRNSRSSALWPDQ